MVPALDRNSFLLLLYSAIIRRSRELFAPPYQCAELYTNTIAPYRLAEVLLKLAQFYNGALCVIEKASAGHTVIDKMRNEYAYPNLYKSKQYDSAGQLRRKPGFETTKKSRPILINDFREAFENGEVCINSKTLLSEM